MCWTKRFLILAAIMLAALLPASAQQAPKRVALVIGNGAYASPGWALANPPRDARLMAERLKSLGFEVDLVVDANRTQLETAMGDFGAKLKRAGPTAVSFFFYAGHGAQKDGANYLVPVDANAATMDRLRFQSPPMQFLLDDMIETGNAVNILVLDACRNLPLPDGARSVGGESLADLGKPQNLFIAYATAPGRTAADGGGANSPFTTALAAALEQQAADPIELLFSDVNSRVFSTTAGGQSPEYRNGLVRAPRWAFAGESAPRPQVDAELARLRHDNEGLRRQLTSIAPNAPPIARAAIPEVDGLAASLAASSYPNSLVVLLGQPASKNDSGQVTRWDYYSYCTPKFATIGMEYHPLQPSVVDVVLLTGNHRGQLGVGCAGTGNTGRLRIAQIPIPPQSRSTDVDTTKPFSLTARFLASIQGCAYVGNLVDGRARREVTIVVKPDETSLSYAPSTAWRPTGGTVGSIRTARFSREGDAAAIVECTDDTIESVGYFIMAEKNVELNTVAAADAPRP